MNEDDFRQLDRIARATQRAHERRREWRQREGGIRSHLSSVAVSIEHWRTAMGIDPALTRRRMENKHVVQILKRRGVEDLAARLR